MAEHGPILMDPSSAHPTSSLTSRILRSDTPTTGASGFQAGTSDTGSSGTNFFTLIYGNLPDKEDIYGAGVTDSNLTLSGLQLSFTITTADTDGEYYVVKSLNKSDTENFPIEAEGVPCYDGVERDTSHATRPWTGSSGTGNIVTAGVIGDDVATYFAGDATGSKTIDLTNLVKQNSLKFGSKFAFIIRKEQLEDENEHIIVADTSTIQMKLLYTDPEPTMPVIKLEADTDYRSSIVTMTTRPSDKDITEFATVWKHNGTDTFENRVGVYYSATNRVQFNGGSQFATGIFKEVDGDIADGFLDDTGETDTLVVWASDMSASGTTTTVKNRTMSNSVSHARMECTASLSAGTAIGEELTLTIGGIVGDGDSTAKNFTKFAVHWDNPTASGGIIKDFNIVTLDAPASSATITHTYDKADTYHVMVCVIDEKGFRSDFVRADGSSRVIADSNPVAVLKASRDTAVRARYGDEFSVMTLSAAQSYPVGSDRIIMAHKFKHDSSDFPLTTFPMDNDNSSFNEVSRAIALKCNVANCDDTVLKVFGKVSVSSDGTPNPDHDEFFDRYEYQVHDLSPHANIDTFGAMATTGGEAVYWKSVDFVVVSSLDAQDTGAVYTLADIKHDHNSGDAADAGYGNIINNKIRAARNTYAWGGYIESGTIQCDFTASTKTIHNDTGNTFITAGFVPGDTIYIEGAVADIANNGFFTIASMDDDEIVVNETIVDESNDAGVKIYKINGPTLPIASYLHTTEGTNPTITCSVVSALAESTSSQNLDTSADVTQVVRFESELYNTLDLDTLADAGNIAITSANLSRSGGINSLMPIGGGAYPVGTTRTTMGTPTLNVSVRTLTQAGYRSIWSLIEGGRYEWVTIDSKQVDAPGTAYKQLRLRLSNGSLTKNPELASEYEASLSFIVIGELVS